MARDKRKTIRFSENEVKILEEKANAVGFDISSYVRAAVFQYNMTVIPGLPELNTQIARIGNNLNQITMLCHQGSIQCPNLEETRRMLNMVYDVLFEIMEVMDDGGRGDGAR